MNRDCAEFRRRLESPATGPDDEAWHHLEVCPRCAAFLDRHLEPPPDGLEHPAWECLPSSLSYNILQDTMSRGASDFWQYLLAGLSGFALAAVVFLIVIRSAPMPALPEGAPVIEQYSFLEPGLEQGPEALSEYTFVEEMQEFSPAVTDGADPDSYDWSFLEPSPHFSFLENDKEALWEDLSNG
ncbi:MAG TPA: hypothetical protein PLU72_09540 [Candidatus Ozemobacteraceae bacterium]|nr:hypothetical protein [Candidatus Ozemobacteraceae bacterium]HQG29135.1 hypothetical protein [Candidatus Ozemobacteraceae bacterium]